MTDIQSIATQIDQSTFDPIKCFYTNLTYYHPLNPIQIPINTQFIQHQNNMTAFSYPQYDQHQPVYFVAVMNQAFQYNSCSDLNNIHQTNNYIPNVEVNPSQQLNKDISINKTIMNDIIDIQEPLDIEENHCVEVPKINVHKTITKARRNIRFLPKLPKRAEKVLKNWIIENYYDPYPMPTEKLYLARECGISINQINYWFKKARKRQADIPCRFSIEIERALLNHLRRNR